MFKALLNIPKEQSFPWLAPSTVPCIPHKVHCHTSSYPGTPGWERYGMFSRTPPDNSLRPLVENFPRHKGIPWIGGGLVVADPFFQVVEESV